ncbi:MAG: DUF4176 domain-containing protein [Oscillospiraceae bacterium]|nr:DUF4176 domain-containing protein [Oscillospiraceae bacterium]
MLEGVLPVGSVVLLKNSRKRVMIIGFAQQQQSSPNVVWDYAGCLYPEGYMGPDHTFLFNTEQIERIYAIGYQDEEQIAFKPKVDALLAQLRTRGEAAPEQNH